MAGFDAGFDPIALGASVGFKPISGYRTQAHQDSLRAQGLTDTKVSQHTLRNAIDFGIPEGWTKPQAMRWWQQNAPGVRVAPTNGNSIHVTFPDWGGAQDISGSARRYGG